ncbi:hypothetical protein [Paraburkholderia aromaticivorans]|uniref:hypothetical protein n=1 Tax=Paraburkholderia aromaticivorans TaxID=2026199 RepID=UPI0014561530|nr:hypothetical protein [Paraburkholderia aromaticivorans]
MAYSCSDFTDDILNCLAHCGAITPESVPDDDPKGQAILVLEALGKMDCSVRASRFVVELLAGVEPVGAIADEYGAAVLSLLLHLQAAINNDTFVEVVQSEMAAVTVIRTLPSADEWMKYVSIA